MSITLICLLAAVVLIVCVFSDRLSGKIGVPALLIFIGVGIFFGSDGVVRIPFENYEFASIVCEASLIVIMFAGGFSMNLQSARKVLLKAGLLSTLGVAVTAAVTFVFCYFLLKIPFAESMLIGSVISSTDAASVFSILRSQKLGLKNGLAPLLEAESGSNDPFSYMLTVISLSLFADHTDLIGIPLMIVQQMFFGVLFGFVVGIAGAYVAMRYKAQTEGFENIMYIAFALLAYGLPMLVGGNGYLSVYIAGVILGNVKVPKGTNQKRQYRDLMFDDPDAETDRRKKYSIKYRTKRFAKRFKETTELFKEKLRQISDFFRSPKKYIEKIPKISFFSKDAEILAPPGTVMFLNGITGICQILVFFLLGLLSTPSEFPKSILPAILIYCCLTFISRPLAVFIFGGKPSKGKWKEWMLLSVAGLRGASSIVFAIMAVVQGVQTEHNIFNIVFCVCILSMLFQGTLLPMTASLLELDEGDGKKNFSDYREENSIMMMRMFISENHAWCNKKLSEIALPMGSLALMVKRGNETIIPRGDTVIEANDSVILSVPPYKEEESLPLREVYIHKKHHWKNQAIRDLYLRKSLFIVMIKRKGESIIPSGSTVIRVDDVVVVADIESSSEPAVPEKVLDPV